MKNKTHGLQRIRYLNVNLSFISHQSILAFKTILKLLYLSIYHYSQVFIFNFISNRYFKFCLLFNANVNYK